MPFQLQLDDERRNLQEPVGFLSKCNPRATPRTAAWKTIKFGIIAAAVWWVAAYFKPAMREDWQVFFPLAVCTASLCGAVIEWQVGDEQQVGSASADAEHAEP